MTIYISNILYCSNILSINSFIKNITGFYIGLDFLLFCYIIFFKFLFLGIMQYNLFLKKIRNTFSYMCKYFKELEINLGFTKFVSLFSLTNLIIFGYPIVKKYNTMYDNFFITLSFCFISYLILISFFSLILFKKSYKVILSAIILINSVIFYFMLTYGVSFDVNMLVNVIETNYSEASEFINLKLFLFIFLLGVAPSVFVYKKVNILFDNYFKKKLLFFISPLVLIFFITLPFRFFENGISFLRYNQRITNYIIPVNYIGACIEFSILKAKSYINSMNLISISDDAEIFEKNYNKNEKKNLIVFMLGESARAKNFSLNGYERDTNSFLNEYKNDIISFKNFESCATFTAGSLTCTFSHLPREKFDYAKSFKYESLIDIFNKVGFDVSWRSNNGRCKGVCDRVKNSLVKSFGDNIYDDLLFKAFMMDLNRIGDKNNLIVLHGRGSHGPLYYNRYPKDFEKYKPACNDDIDKCNVDEIVNAYDNTIYYTSYIIKEVIDELKKRSDEYNTILIYMSDHGQSLGENGVFMHSAPFDTAPVDQKNPAFFIWMPDDFASTFHIDKPCLKDKIKDNISQDNIFHSMLGIFKIKSKYYDGNLDIFNSCIKENNRLN